MRANEWGRVAEDGTVFVRTSTGERAVGQWPDGSPEEALEFFTKRYEGLALEVDLLERRIRSGKLNPDEAGSAMRKVRKLVAEAQAVGDLDGLLARIDALDSVVSERREERKAERARRIEEARTVKEQIATEAEDIARGNDWRNGANRLRDLLERWKSLPRLDKAADDALWRRFSSARTAYTRRRKQHFGELNEKRDAAKVVKEKLAAEAESLADSTEWGPTAGRFRDLMRQWKAAGPTHKDIDDKLWARFRGAQDTFFSARVMDVRAAREAFRDVAARWDQAGKVPRAAIRDLEGRLRRVENAIKDAEQERWRRSNPEARARAADTVAQLESSLAELEAQKDSAQAKGNDRKVRDAEQAIEARRSWLDQARKALDEFTPEESS